MWPFAKQWVPPEKNLSPGLCGKNNLGSCAWLLGEETTTSLWLMIGFAILVQGRTPPVTSQSEISKRTDELDVVDATFDSDKAPD